MTEHGRFDPQPERSDNGPRGIRRRDLLIAAGLSGGIGAAAVAGVKLDGPAPPREQEAFYGVHQPGISTPPQQYVQLAAFDLSSDGIEQVQELLRTWSVTADRLMRNVRIGTDEQAATAAPGDPGEADGLPPSRLTLTFGLGPSIFDGALGQMKRRQPAALNRMPAFRGDALEPAYSDGDLCVQACADDLQVAFHAIHTLAVQARGIAGIRWMQHGFRSHSPSSSHRNLMGFKDGTSNVDASDPAVLERAVWVGRCPTEPPWMRDGSYMVVRRIKMLFDVWDLTSLEGQERAIGRRKRSGAPLGQPTIAEKPDLDRSAIPFDAHIRLAAPASNAGAELLRRSYSYSNGVDSSGHHDAGLLFIAFQRDPTEQFVRIQRRLGETDGLNKHVQHVGSAVFACPPGASPDGFVGHTLFS